MEFKVAVSLCGLATNVGFLPIQLELLPVGMLAIAVGKLSATMGSELPVFVLIASAISEKRLVKVACVFGIVNNSRRLRLLSR